MTVTLRMGLVLLAAGIVIAVAALLTPPFRPGQQEAGVLQNLVQRRPAPAAEATLRQAISEIQRRKPDYAAMSPELARFVRDQVASDKAFLAPLGALQSLRYVGSLPRPDFYRASFQNGSLCATRTRCAPRSSAHAGSSRAQVRAYSRVVSMISAAMIQRGFLDSFFGAGRWPESGARFFGSSRRNNTEPGNKLTRRSCVAL